MNLQDIKELVAEDGGRVIIVERDAVVAVVLSHEAYKALKARSGSAPRAASREIPKPVSSPVSAPAPGPSLADTLDFEESDESDELTIDDLPL